MTLRAKLLLVLSQLLLALLTLGCASGSPSTLACASVESIWSNPESCSGRSIRLKAYLVSTRHGDYLADTANGRAVLGVTFSDSEAHRKSTIELLEKLGRANVGKPYAQIYGVFEGIVIVIRGESRGRFEISSEVTLPDPPN